MAFDVLIADEAFRDLDAISGFIRTKSSIDQGRKWFDSITANILSLREMPSRCSICQESEELGAEVRVLLHGPKNRTYKIYFTICHDTPRNGTVRVFHIRHWARNALSTDELQELMDDDGNEQDEE